MGDIKIIVSTEIDGKVRTLCGLKRNLQLKLETTIKLLRRVQGQFKCTKDHCVWEEERRTEALNSAEITQ